MHGCRQVRLSKTISQSEEQHMLRTTATALTLLLCIIAGKATAQEFENFRFVGENTAGSGGFVTSLSLDPVANTGTLSFLNVAGLSAVYNITLTPSEVIRDGMPVFKPTEDFGDYLRSLDLDGIEFFTAKLSSPDGNSLPPHWFRLTRFNNEISGVFRISDRIYSMDRLSESGIVDVRYTPSTKAIFQPARRVKISAVIDEEYMQHFSATDTRNTGQLVALESIHIMDGLLADSLSLTLLLDQLIYQPASDLSVSSQAVDIETGAVNWLNTNSNTFGLTDNLATLFFREVVNQNHVDNTTDNGLVNSRSIIQGSSSHAQFATAHYFGRLLGIGKEPNTIQDWKNSEVSLPAVHWSEQQTLSFNQNLPAPELTQPRSYDAPEVTKPAPEPTVPVNEQFVDSDSYEAQPGIFDDGQAPSSQSGGGAFVADTLGGICLLLVAGLRNRRIMFTS